VIIEDEATPSLAVSVTPTIPAVEDATHLDQPRLVPCGCGSTTASIHSVDQEASLSEDLWVVAYQKLRAAEETAKVMEAYETILTNIYSENNESGVWYLHVSCLCALSTD
jgi:hypothetical protein